MKVIVISDIHGNLEALNKVLEYTGKLEGDKRFVCLGDTVGYGPNPAECFKIVESLTDQICLGNHEDSVLNTNYDYQITEYALEAIRWTRGVLDKEIKKATTKLPFQIEENDILYSHATPDQPMLWRYISNARKAYSSLIEMNHALCFVGHSHRPGIYSYRQLQRNSKKATLSKDDKTIVNVGSVGQPRDGSPLLSFAIFDDKDWNIEIIRLEYDYQKTMEKIKKANLPLFLAERLARGV
ncbi:diadenosine tetraphosphatase and related serine /threonine protein phosphatase [Candidatus Scalindua japonica]|uniref:Diadenosine tetraphosphatase and related serine /threonine protein phosphatase n=1 Tax=Candidatus Scalindua japonica TaxID=1284222 RepID=A0A286U3W1_9BACT|nr:metallophosphoesterase family protein [Candidatus Scalindua japonica]GAX62838.1 diadenosine tetraphosphatase and related serine /threonine protein phosphatase [Candidatus Scalindua japonica]